MIKTIIKLTADSNGAHRNQTSEIKIIPDGWAVIPDNLLPAWQQYRPFVALTVADGVIAGMADNPEAREAQALIDAQEAENG